MRTKMITTMLGIALLAAAPMAWAFGFGGPGGGPGMMGGPGPGAGMPIRLLVAQFTPDQRKQARQIFAANRTQMRSLAEQLHQAHDALATKMFTAGTVTDADVAPLVQEVATLHQQLLTQGTKVMLQVRAIATPDQLAKAATTKAKMDDLHQQMRALLGPPSDEDVPPPPE